MEVHAGKRRGNRQQLDCGFFFSHEDDQILEQTDRKGVEYLSLEVFRTPLDMPLRSLIQLDLLCA